MRKCLLAIAAILMAGGQWASALESPYVGRDVSGDDFAGENKGVIPVKINPAGLSPDSIYFLAFRIDSFDAYEADPENNYLLYRVRTYNAWARSDGSSSYTMMGQRTEDGEDAWLRMPGSKVFYPISGNVVRTMAANEEFGSSSINLDRYAMLIEIGGDGSLKLSPYRDSITLPKGRSKLKFCMDKASYNLLEMKFTYRQP
ncbi:MAG: BT_3044 domain-containing protein [Muribaculaceae bacterium]